MSLTSLRRDPNNTLAGESEASEVDYVILNENFTKENYTSFDWLARDPKILKGS